MTRFTRQIPLTTTFYNAYNILSGNNIFKYVYAYVPQNNAGLYGVPSTNGLIISSFWTELFPSFGASLVSRIQEAISAAGGVQNIILRDMGQTVFSEYLAFPFELLPVQAYGYFRKVQLLYPTPLGSNGWNGGPNGTTFGVLGMEPFFNNDGTIINTTSYLSFYIPVTIAGSAMPYATSTQAYAYAGGQL